MRVPSAAFVVLGLASHAVAQYGVLPPGYSYPGELPGTSTSLGPSSTTTSTSSALPPPPTGTVAPLSSTSSSSTPPPYSESPPPPAGSLTTLTYYDCTTDTSPPEETVTEVETSTYCHRCEEVYTTIYSISGVNVCETGTYVATHTVTQTVTGNPQSFTPPTVPPGFTVYETICTACHHPENTVTVTVPIATNGPAITPAAPPPSPPPGAGAAPPPPPPGAAPPVSPTIKPAQSSPSYYPPVVPTGPQQVPVSVASVSGSSIPFITVAVGLLSILFAGMIMA